MKSLILQLLVPRSKKVIGCKTWYFSMNLGIHTNLEANLLLSLIGCIYKTNTMYTTNTIYNKSTYKFTKCMYGLDIVGFKY